MNKQIIKNGEIEDIVANEYCSREILRYSDMINRKGISNYSVAELIEFLIRSDEKYALVTMQQSSLTVCPLKDMNVMLRIIA